ncbi:MAG: class GN sortase [Kiloniellales bacterium]
MRRAHLVAALALLPAAFGLWQLGEGALIPAKAWLAQRLIAQAWERTLAGEAAVRPWPWADTWPVARLTLPGAGQGTGKDLYVLAAADGSSLAFGPGRVVGTAEPGLPGVSILAGHRDTHFAALADLAPGDRLAVERPDGSRIAFLVTATAVVDARNAALRLPGDGKAHLLLVTCWPFDAIRPGGPLRYAVSAEAETESLLSRVEFHSPGSY